MCVSDGAPKHPLAQDDKMKGVQELWDLLQKHNAVFLGDSDLKGELDRFLKSNKIRHEDSTPKQKEYVKKLEKAINEYSIVG